MEMPESGRTCAICGKRGLIRLDKHLKGRHKLSSGTAAYNEAYSNHGAGEGNEKTGEAPPSGPQPGAADADDADAEVDDAETDVEAVEESPPIPPGQAEELASAEPGIEELTTEPPWDESSEDEEPGGTAFDPDLGRETCALLREYVGFVSGSLPHGKDRSNRVVSVKRVASVLRFLRTKGSSESPADLLRQFGRIHAWMRSQADAGLKPTTIRNYLIDVSGFLNFCRRFRKRRVDGETVRRAIMTLSSVLRGQRRDVRAHRDGVFRRVEELVLSAQELQQITEEIRLAIPRQFALLEDAPTHRSAGTVAAHLVVYLTAFNGTRRGEWWFHARRFNAPTSLQILTRFSIHPFPGTFINMTREDVLQARERDGFRLVTVAKHKTSHIHGEAVVCCKPDEYEWIRRFIEASRRLPGNRRRPRTLFFTSSGRPFENLSTFTSRLLSALGYPGLTLHKLRHSLATLSWSRLEPVDRTILAKHMAHSLTTQEAFYVRLSAPEQHLRARRLIDTLMVQ